jgi:hypothetical protein
MNEKIKELAIKSWLVSEHKGKLLSCYREDVDLTKYLEDFAELIVKETLQVARAGIAYGDGMEDAVYKYFGVKE